MNERFDWDKARCEYHPKYGRETVVPYRKGVRVQHKRGKKLPPNTKLVARPSRWGNPYKIGDLHKVDGVICENLTRTRDDVLRLYDIWLDNKLEEDPTFIDPLRGFDLAGWCPLDKRCHVDILLRRLK